MAARAWFLVLVTILLVTAGCQGYGEQTATLTPAPLPGSSPVSSPATYPPGVTSGGVDNASALVAAHLSGLENRSYTVVDTELYTVENGPREFRSETTVRIGANRRRYHYETDVTGAVELTLQSERHREVWSDGERVFVAENGSCGGENDPRRDSRPPNAALPVDPEYRQQLRFVLSATETETTGVVTEDGTRLFRVETTDIQGGGLSNVENLSLLAWIDEDGVVRRYRISYLTVAEGRLLRVRETLRFVTIDETEIERPDWLTCLEQSSVDG